MGAPIHTQNSGLNYGVFGVYFYVKNNMKGDSKMSILSGFRKQKRYTTDDKGRHQLISTWTHIDTVYDDEGKSLTEIIEELPASDTKVTQTPTNTDNNYEVLFSNSPNNLEEADIVRKSSSLKFNPNTKNLFMQDSGFGGSAGGKETDIYSGSLGLAYSKYFNGGDSIYNDITMSTSDNDAMIEVQKSSQIEGFGTNYVTRIKYDDIQALGYTWDGTNTSLKTALTNVGTKVLYGTSAPTSSQGEDGQLYVKLKILNPYLDNFIVDYGLPDPYSVDTELEADNLGEVNIYVKQYQMVANVETLVGEYEGSIDFAQTATIHFYNEEVSPRRGVCQLMATSSVGSPRTIHIEKDYDDDKIVVTITDADAEADAIDTIYIKDEGAWLPQVIDSGVPSPTSSDINKVLMATDEGEYGWEEVSTGSDNICVPPVIFDDDKLKTMTIDGFPGITKVYMTQSDYEALTVTEKEDLSKIYYISDYEFFPSDDGKVVIRFNQDGTEKLIFFNGFVDNFNTVTPYSNFPEELRTIVTNNAIWGSGATILSTNYDSEGVVRSGNEAFFGIRTTLDWHVNSCNSSGGSYAAKNKANYAILDMLSNTQYQLSPSWSDPYDIPYGYDAIYYGGKEYEEFYIPKELPYVTSSDAGKVLKVNSQGIWTKGDGGSEAVYKTLAEYQALTQAQKEDPTKIYFVKDEGTVVSEVKTQDDGTVTASSYYSSNYPWKIFDAIGNNTRWIPNDETSFSGSWFKYEFSTKQTFTSIDIWLSTWDPRLVRVVIEASNDNSTWINITQDGYYDIETSRSGYNTLGTKYSFVLTSTAYKYIRVTFTLSPDTQTSQSETALYVQNCNIYASLNNTPRIYYTDILFTPDELPSTAIADAGKILQVNSDGEWDKGNVPRTNAVQVPPVLYDNNNLFKMTVDSFPGLEKIYLTAEEYTALTATQKQDLSKIYYVSPYKYYDVFEDGKVIIRTYGTTYEWFFNGMILTDQDPVLYIPNQYVQYTKNTPYQGSTAWSDTSSTTSLGIIEIGAGGYVDRITAQTGNWAGQTIKYTPIYGKVVIDNGSSQTNVYSDPYDTPSPIEIFYGGKQYTGLDVKPMVYREITQADYDLLPASKNSDGIIYFITDNS